jgi:hypothetical protein
MFYLTCIPIGKSGKWNRKIGIHSFFYSYIRILFKFKGKFSNMEHLQKFYDTVLKFNVLPEHVFQH